MPRFTIETTYRLPICRQRAHEADVCEAQAYMAQWFLSELRHAIYLFDISPSWRRLSFVCPFVSAATTTPILIFHRPRSHCISSPARS
jgi:hypothetical protein